MKHNHTMDLNVDQLVAIRVYILLAVSLRAVLAAISSLVAILASNSNGSRILVDTIGGYGIPNLQRRNDFFL